MALYGIALQERGQSVLAPVSLKRKSRILIFVMVSAIVWE